MKGYRNGEQVVYCDGCFEVIVGFSPKIHNIGMKAGNPHRRHACSVPCARKVKRNPVTYPPPVD